MSFHPVDLRTTKVDAMLTDRELKSHDDHEDFAKYLGVDYDTYCEAVLGVSEEELELEHESLVGISNAYQSKR